jgi:hypothetical protein
MVSSITRHVQYAGAAASRTVARANVPEPPPAPMPQWRNGKRLVQPIVPRVPVLEVPFVPKSAATAELRRGPEPKKPWTAEHDAILRKRWRETVSVECIAEELDRTSTDVKRRRKLLDLPKRRGNERKCNVKVNVDVATFDCVGRVARSRHLTVSEYIRTLIKQDLELPA